MKFRVTGVVDIMCNGCGGTTRAVPKKIYDTNDLACNCVENPPSTKADGVASDGTGVYKWLASWFKFN